MPDRPGSDSARGQREPGASDAEPPQPAAAAGEEPLVLITPWTPPVVLPASAWKRTRLISAITAKQRH